MLDKPATPPETIFIAGRQFRGVGRDCTLAHDVWVMDRIRACKLEVIERDASESDDLFVRRVFLQASSNPDFFELMGGLLVPAEMEDAAWSPGLAKLTGEFFAGVTTREDKETIKAQVVATLVGFFVYGLTSMRISPKSSTPPSSEPEAVFYEAPDITPSGIQ